MLVKTRSTALENIRVLLLEDDALISLDTEDMLLDLGAAQVHVAHSLAEAESILATDAVDAAVLDLVIGAQRSEDLARRLVQQSLPIIIASGYGEAGLLTEGFEDVPVVRKPCSVDALEAALLTALGR